MPTATVAHAFVWYGNVVVMETPGAQVVLEKEPVEPVQALLAIVFVQPVVGSLAPFRKKYCAETLFSKVLQLGAE